MRRQLLLLGAGSLIVVGAACGNSTGATDDCRVGPTAASAEVTIAWTSRPDSMRVLVNGSSIINAACSYVRTRSGPNILAGRIVRGAGVDPRVPFHYLPDSVTLVDLTIELCDSELLRTTEQVDAYFLGSTGRVDSPSAPYCPWGARPVRVSPVE
ncbi:MAG: hypothetical protein Q8K55_11650 [Gemmatimonadaceae bacterium]|nr:hypothetical protein [Gemmatimonadaceae bacterium]